MYDYQIVTAINNLIRVVQGLETYLHSVLTPLLYLIIFAILLKICFTCMRGYKV